MELPGLYAIADAEVLKAREVGLREFAAELVAAGVRMVQYRDKLAGPRDVLAGAAVLRGVFAATGCRLIMNDRADLAVLAGFDGVHVGQEDLTPEDARRVLGSGGLVGVSTHTEAQVIAADGGCADYMAVGPVFATGTKADAAVVVGLEGVRRARALTVKPLVAIGGITRANARSVLDAGADAVAVISGLFAPGESVEQVGRDFMQILR